MARKKRGKKVAARQAQLSKRKKRGRGPSGIPTMSAAQRRRQLAESPQPSADSEAIPTQTAPAIPVAAAASPTPNVTSTVSDRQPLVYSYVGMEMRRILTLSGVIIAAIVALSFFLN